MSLGDESDTRGLREQVLFYFKPHHSSHGPVRLNQPSFRQAHKFDTSRMRIGRAAAEPWRCPAPTSAPALSLRQGTSLHYTWMTSTLVWRLSRARGGPPRGKRSYATSCRPPVGLNNKRTCWTLRSKILLVCNDHRQS